MPLLFHGVLPLGALTGGAIAQAMGVPSAANRRNRSSAFDDVLVFSPVRQLRELPHAVEEIRA